VLGVDGVLVPGGFGSRGWEGKILACRVARERGIPYLGICLGMHVAVSEFARHVVGLEDANSTEMDPETPHPVIDLLPEQKDVEDLGGTMRLGADPVELVEGTRAAAAYGESVVYERHRHRYEVNNEYRAALVDALAGSRPSFHVTPATTDLLTAQRWFEEFEGAGLDGVIAKPLTITYQPDKRVMFKVKHDRTADCVVAGYRVHQVG